MLLAAGVGGFASMQANAGALDGGTANGGSTSEAVGAGATTGGGWDVALGSNATTVSTPRSNSYGAIAIGGGAMAWGANSISPGANVAIGYQSVAGRSDDSTSQATAVGTWAQATNWATTAIGDAALASGNYTTVLGSQSTASGDQSTVVGAFTQASATNSTAIGEGANASTTGSVALGYGSTTTANLSAAGYNPGTGTLSGTASTANGEVSVGSAGAERRVTNVAAGSAATDAVNVSQLQSEDAKVNTINNNVNTLSNNVTNIAGNVTNISNTVNNITNGGGIKYFHANSTLADSSATGTDAVAIGGNAQATAANSVALGSNSTTTANLSAAGYNPGTGTLSGIASAANGEVSVGAAGKERRITNVAAGSAATDAVNVSQLQSEDAKVNTINNNVNTLSNNVTNIAGNVTNISNTVNNITNGGGVKYFHANSTLADSSATGTNSLAAGPAAVASAADAIALGNGAKATNAGAVALGAGSTTTTAVATSGTTIGGITYTFAGIAPSSTVSVGTVGSERTITNVAAGRLSATSTDAVNGSELFATNQQVTRNTTDITNLTNNMNIGSVGLVQQDATTRNITVAKATDGTLVDFTGTAGARQLTGVAAGAVNATSADAVNGSQLYGVSQSVADAIGGGSTVNTDGSISAPSYVVNGTTVHNAGDAISNLDNRVTQNTTDISTINSTLNNITTGSGVMYVHVNSTLADSLAKGAESVAIGGNAQSQAANSVALGSNSVADRANTVSVGAAGAERQITNVAAGTADTDAVNVAQLKASGVINTDGTTNAAVTYDHNADGSANYNSVTMGNGVAGGTKLHNVAAGSAADDAVNVSQMNAAISNVTNIINSGGNPLFAADGNHDTDAAMASGTHATAMGANAKASAANSVALGANSVADRANTVSVGSAGSERQITNVAAGTTATDAVNVGQLNEAIGASVGNLPAGTSAKDYTDQQINAVQNGVNQVAKNAYAGIAAATALTMIPDVDQGKTIAVGVGGGSYKGSQAVALGISARITQNLKMKAGAGTSSQGTTVGVGASYQW
ncbi:YadA-like family protein [Paraburkholderia aromaticivorans]|uniref:YadA-like family protein n=1 Tax=Paraburkholderia aromaticivorans TaxID=2026199 RepID=UPI003CC60713